MHTLSQPYEKIHSLVLQASIGGYQNFRQENQHSRMEKTANEFKKRECFPPYILMELIFDRLWTVTSLIYNKSTMIRQAVRRLFPSIPKHSPFLLQAPRFKFSRTEKFAKIKAVLEHEIKAQTEIASDLRTYENLFKTLGWTVKQQNTLVQLSKRVDNYSIRLLSDIKAPAIFQTEDKDEQGKEEGQKSGQQMNEVTICITADGNPKTLVIHTSITTNFEIIGINFAQNYKQAKQQREDFLSVNQYLGPAVETLPDPLFESINTFISDLGLSYDLLENVANYCLNSEQTFYINWLQDFKNTL